MWAIFTLSQWSTLVHSINTYWNKIDRNTIVDNKKVKYREQDQQVNQWTPLRPLHWFMTVSHFL